MVDAPISGGDREVALDGVGRGAGPGVLGRHASLLARPPWGSGLRSLFLSRALRPPREAVLVIGASRAVAEVAAHVASCVRRAAVPAMAARAMSLSILRSGGEQGHSHHQRRRPSGLQFQPARRSASSKSTAASCGVTHRSNTTPHGHVTVSR
jgi:hypothetical protein